MSRWQTHPKFHITLRCRKRDVASKDGIGVSRELRGIDHFGTGQATFSELSAVEFDVLKIDRSFVRDARRHSTYVLEAMRSMGEALDLKVIVEGIETAEELAIVERSGVPFAQGYHLGRPVDEDTLLLGVGVTGEPGGDDSVDGDVDLAGAAAEHGDD